jgi:RNA polymerase sigma-70 factor (ECF subfamily)
MEATLSPVKKLELTAARRRGDPDHEAVERVLAGDPSAFATLVRRHQRGVYFLCLRYLRHPEDAADLTQRALLRSYEKLSSFGGRSAFRTWLYRIAVNLCLNAIRDRDRRPTVGLEPQIGAVEASQHDELDHSQRRDQLRNAVESLPPKQRMTVILRIYHELPFAEVAEVMGGSVGSAKVNYHHAMKRLRSLQELEQEQEART